MENYNKIIFLVFLFLILSFNLFNIVVNDYEKNDRTTNYSEINVRRAKKILGHDIELSDYERQFPPLYSFLLIPVVIFNIPIMIYEILLFFIFSIMTCIVMFYISEKNLFITLTIFATNYIFMFVCLNEVGSITYVTTFLVTLLLYLLKDIENKRKIVLSGIVFSIAVSFQFVILFMIPFILLWFYYLTLCYYVQTFKYQIKSFFKKSITFFLPSIICLTTIFSIRILNHGLTMKGLLGGYSTYFSFGQKFLEIRPENIIHKLASTSNNLHVFVIIIYIISFLFVIMYSRNKLDVFSRKEKTYYKLILFNIMIFLFIPCMAWENPYIIYRYLIYFIPYTTTIVFLYFNRILRNEKNRCL